MKSNIYFFLAIFFAAALVSCKDDDEPRKGDPDLTHDGQPWSVASVEYTLLDQGAGSGGIGQTYKQDTKQNAGTFYFTEGSQGSFEIQVEGYNKEDVFSYTIEDDQISIVAVSQSVGVKTNQNVVALSGQVISETERTLSGTIIKQSTTGQFMLEVDMTLTKK